MTTVDAVAAELGISGRTLRRGIALGLVKGSLLTSRWMHLAPGEEAYLQRHWPLLDALRRALRNESQVRFAVLHGAAARRDAPADAASTLRLLVQFFDESPLTRPRLHAKLCRATARDVGAAVLDDVQDQPTLLLDVLRHGRVLVDRRGTDWRKLRRQHWRLLQAERAAAAQ